MPYFDKKFGCAADPPPVWTMSKVWYMNKKGLKWVFYPLLVQNLAEYVLFVAIMICI